MKTVYHPDGVADVWGIKCKFVSVDHDDAKELLKNGWFESPLDFDKKEPETEPETKTTKRSPRKKAVNNEQD